MKNIFNISACMPFAHSLAKWVLGKYGQSPDSLSEVLILVPSRRAIRSLREAFLQEANGKPLLLPTIEALGDIDKTFILRHAILNETQLQKLHAIPQAISPMARILQLSNLVWKFLTTQTNSISNQSQAIELAHQLADFIDEMQREQCSWQQLEELAPVEYAKYWQDTTAFLQIVSKYWPEYLAENNKSDIWEFKNKLLTILAECWQQHLPSKPIIAAGTTGSVESVANLLSVISELPNGMVVLPGLDQYLDEKTYKKIEATHPQYGLKQLLGKLGVKKQQITDLCMPHPKRKAREKLLSIAMLPATETPIWHNICENLDIDESCKNIHILECNNIHHEANNIAILLRETLETPGKTAALITNNRILSRQVTNQLSRWGIEIDDSAGMALHTASAATLMLLLLEAIERNLSPVAILSLLKHPLAVIGNTPAATRNLARKLEDEALRGIKPVNWQSVVTAVEHNKELHDFVIMLTDIMQPLSQLFSTREANLHNIITTHITVAEKLATTHDGKCLLWSGEEGKELANFFSKLQLACEPAPIVSLYDYRNILRSMLARTKFYSAWAKHPRLHILSPIEARMQHYNRVILADLNEGSWPGTKPLDPWLNHRMRKTIGLPTYENNIGMAAHDFVQIAAAAEEVFCTRSLRISGTLTVSSRFLLRIETLLQVINPEKSLNIHKHQSIYLASKLDIPTEYKKLLPPNPKPPADMRPKELYVTHIETLMRNPYGLYAKKILRLAPKLPLEQLPQPSDFGDAVHSALECYANSIISTDDNNVSLDILLQCGKKAFAPYNHAFVVDALWWPRFQQIAKWIIKQKWQKNCISEIVGMWEFATHNGTFSLKAKADRIDIENDTLTIIDYKTGNIPSNTDIKLGIANQLLLTAVIAANGGFGKQLHKTNINLEYWQLIGGHKGGKIIDIAKATNTDIKKLVEQAECKLQQLIAEFNDPGTGYPAIPDIRNQPKYDDYRHLSRIDEWSSNG